MDPEFIPLMKPDWLVTPAMVKESELKKSLDFAYCHISGVVGTEHVDQFKLKYALKAREAELHPEPNNRFDSNAVGVWVGEVKIGWVPSRYNAWISSCVAFLRGEGHKCKVPIQTEDGRDYYKDFRKDPDIDAEFRQFLRKHPYFGISYSMYLPTFRTLFVGHRADRAFIQLDRIWDQFSGDEIDAIRDARFHVDDNVAELFLKNKHLAPAFPWRRTRGLKEDWLLDQYLVSYRRHIYQARKKQELAKMKYEIFLRSNRGQSAVEIAGDYPRSVATVRAYIRESKKEAARRPGEVLPPPSLSTEGELRELYRKKWVDWARNPQAKTKRG